MKNRTQPFLVTVIIVVTLVLVMLLRACATKPDPDRPPPAAQRVRAMVVAPGDTVPVLTLYGRAEPEVQTQITASATGVVAQVQAVSGRQIPRGGLMMALAPDDVSLAVRERISEVLSIESDLAAEKERHKINLQAVKRLASIVRVQSDQLSRMKTLMASGYVSQTDLDRARGDLDRAELELAQRRQEVNIHDERMASLQARLEQARAASDRVALEEDRLSVRAPFDAVVTEVMVNQGMRVVQGTPLMHIYEPASISVRGQIPGKALDRVRRAMTDGLPPMGVFKANGAAWSIQMERFSGQVFQRAGGEDGWFSIIPGSWDYPPPSGAKGTLQVSLPPEPDSFAMPPAGIYKGRHIYRIARQDDGLHLLEELDVEMLGQTRVGDALWPLVHAPGVKVGDLLLASRLPNAMSGLAVAPVRPEAGTDENTPDAGDGDEP